MTKKTLPFFISFLLTLTVLAPTVISFLDVDNEIVIVLENTEEENNSLETAKELETSYFVAINVAASFTEVREQKNIRFRNKKYISLTQDLFFPPPEILFFS